MLGSYVRFRLFFDAGSDPSHVQNASQFTDDLETSAAPSWGQYVQNVFEMKDYTNTFSTRERGMFGIHWINTTAGALDTSWIAADYTSVESAIQTMWTALAAKIGNDIRLVEHRWYSFGPTVVKPNPPSRVTTLGTPLVGSAANTVPHQSACTVTLRTALRRHWGRFYLPLNNVIDGAGGQIYSTSVDAIATAARTMLMAPGTSQGVLPVVWDRNARRAYGVTAIESDSVPDIIRRRRPRTTGYKKIFTS